jgi:hypothetical protein
MREQQKQVNAGFAEQMKATPMYTVVRGGRAKAR